MAKELIVQKDKPNWILGFEPAGPNRLLRAGGQLPRADPPGAGVTALEKNPVMLKADDVTRSKVRRKRTTMRFGFAKVPLQ